jgi:hypothetical protein
MVNSKILLSSQRLWVKQTSWIYRFEATASCCILCKENPLLNNVESLQEEFMRKLSTAFGTILKYCNMSNVLAGWGFSISYLFKLTGFRTKANISVLLIGT